MAQKSDIQNGLSPNGLGYLTKSHLLDFLDLAARNALVISNIEAFEVDGSVLTMNMEHSLHFSDERPNVPWTKKVAESASYAKGVIDPAPDGTVFRVWLSNQET